MLKEIGTKLKVKALEIYNSLYGTNKTRLLMLITNFLYSALMYIKKVTIFKKKNSPDYF